MNGGKDKGNRERGKEGKEEKKAKEGRKEKCMWRALVKQTIFPEEKNS